MNEQLLHRTAQRVPGHIVKQKKSHSRLGGGAREEQGRAGREGCLVHLQGPMGSWALQGPSSCPGQGDPVDGDELVKAV